MNDAPLTSSEGLEGLDYAAIAAYLLVTFGIAVWFGSRQKDTEDFFVGGRRMPWMAVGMSILATLFSTLSYVGIPGEMIKQGAALFLGYLAAPLSFLVIAYLLIPFFMRLRLTSAYEYLERRFSYSVRLLGAALFVLLRLGWMSMVVFAASMGLEQVLGGDLEWLPGPDLLWWIGVVGLVAAVYTCIGGIQAVIWVDVLQCVLLLAGVLLAIGYVVWADGTGPLEWWRVATTQSSNTRVAPPLFGSVTERNTVLWTMTNVFFWSICTHGSDQVVLQRYFSTSSLKAARRSYFTHVIVELTMISLASLAGLALLAFYVRHSGLLPGEQSATEMADKLFPYFLGHQLPAGCAGLVISAFLCDAIQTLESGVNAATAVATKDLLYHRPGHPEAPPEEEATIEAPSKQLTAARWLTLGITAFVTFTAYGVAYIQRTYGLTLVDMMPKFFNMFVGPLAAMFFVGMFAPRCTTRSVLPAAVCGLGISIVWSWWEYIFQTDWRPTIFLSVAVPCVTTFVIAALLSLIVDRGGRHSGSDYTWRAIVQGDPK